MTTPVIQLGSRRRTWSMLGVIAIAATGAGLQFTTPPRTNPPVNPAQTLEATTAVPDRVSTVFARACRDCHSNDTRWPWYAHVAPGSWLMVDHVTKGRADWNMSEWGQYSARRKETRLRAVCAEARTGAMPPPSYAAVHRDARLHAADVHAICEWTERAKQALAAIAEPARPTAQHVGSAWRLPDQSASPGAPER